MGEEMTWLAQAIGVIGVGSFVGEYYRNSLVGFTYTTAQFTASYLAGAFLSLLLAYTVYYYSDNRPISLIIGGFVAYQDEKFISQFVREFLHKWLHQTNKEE